VRIEKDGATNQETKQAAKGKQFSFQSGGSKARNGLN
jgi:hypothetical protein